MTEMDANQPDTMAPAAVTTTPADRRLHRVLLVLIILGCVGVTSLLILNVMEKRSKMAGGGKDLQGKSHTPTLFDQPLDMAPFTLTDQDGQPFGSDQLKGKVFVANFFFSSCPGMCPQILAHTSRLQAKLKEQLGVRVDDVKLISISVDPETDTPARLHEIAELWDADPTMWRFLTGTREQVWQVILKSFRHNVSDNTTGKGEPIIHSPNFVLVDHLGRIRGFYNGLDEDERSELLRDLLRLMSGE